MIPNMYQHQIDELLERARAELRIYKQFNRTEYVEHVKRRIESLERLRVNARKACFATTQQDEIIERKTLGEILAEFTPY